MLSQLALVVCLCATASAFVDYGDSALYDEFDFSTYKTFPLAECLASSCKVYVSAPNSSFATLDKIYLGDTTLAALAKHVDAETGLKRPYNLKAYSGKNFITNLNWLFASAPVAVYVVYERSAFYNTADVYEPSSSPLSVNWSNSNTLTLLSATNFTVKGLVKKGSLVGGRVVSGGYDVAHRRSSKVPSLVDFKLERTFDFSVHSPLVTLYSPLDAEVVVSIKEGSDEAPSSQSFLASPGYTGVQFGQVYLSSLYNRTVQYHLPYRRKATVHFKAFLNTFADSVEITVDGKEKFSLRGTRGLSTYNQTVDVQGQDIVVRFTKTTPFSSFLLRVSAELEKPDIPSLPPFTLPPITLPPISIRPISLRPRTKRPVPSEAPVTSRPVTEAPVEPTHEPVTPETEAPVVPVATDVPVVPEETAKPESPEERKTERPEQPVEETPKPVVVEPEEPSDVENDVPVIEAEDLRRRYRHGHHPIA